MSSSVNFNIKGVQGTITEDQLKSLDTNKDGKIDADEYNLYASALGLIFEEIAGLDSDSNSVSFADLQALAALSDAGEDGGNTITSEDIVVAKKIANNSNEPDGNPVNIFDKQVEYNFDLTKSTSLPKGTVLDPAIWNIKGAITELIASGLVTQGTDGSLTVTSDITLTQGTITTNGVTYPVTLAGDAKGNMLLLADFNGDGNYSADELFSVKLTETGTVDFYDKANGTLLGISSNMVNNGTTISGTSIPYSPPDFNKPVAYSFDLTKSTSLPKGTVLDPAMWSEEAIDELIASGLVTKATDGTLTVKSDISLIQGTITSNGIPYPATLLKDANGNIVQLLVDSNKNGKYSADNLFSVKLSESGSRLEFYDKANGTLLGISRDMVKNGTILMGKIIPTDTILASLISAAGSDDNNTALIGLNTLSTLPLSNLTEDQQKAVISVVAKAINNPALRIVALNILTNAPDTVLATLSSESSSKGGLESSDTGNDFSKFVTNLCQITSDQNGDSTIRIQAIKLLGRVSNSTNLQSTTINTIINSLSSSDKDIQTAAHDALISIGDTVVKPYLEEYLANGTVNATATSLLAEINNRIEIRAYLESMGITIEDSQLDNNRFKTEQLEEIKKTINTFMEKIKALGFSGTTLLDLTGGKPLTIATGAEEYGGLSWADFGGHPRIEINQHNSMDYFSKMVAHEFGHFIELTVGGGSGGHYFPNNVPGYKLQKGYIEDATQPDFDKEKIDKGNFHEDYGSANSCEDFATMFQAWLHGEAPAEGYGTTQLYRDKMAAIDRMFKNK